MGGCFISLGLFISSTTKNQIVAGVATFVVFLLSLDHRLVRRERRADRRADPDLPVDHRALRRLRARASSTPNTCVYYLSFITFGLFLTAKSVDTERWRG